jgi:hypothetical protein
VILAAREQRLRDLAVHHVEHVEFDLEDEGRAVGVRRRRVGGGASDGVRMMKPSVASPFHDPLRPTSSVNVLTSCTEGSSNEGVGMKPDSRANASSAAGGWVRK